MTEAEIDAIEARANAATEGPWKVLPPCMVTDGRGMVIARTNDSCNDEFISHARTDVPALIAEVRRLRKYLERHGIEKCLHPDGVQRRRDGSWCHLCGEVFFGKFV